MRVVERRDDHAAYVVTRNTLRGAFADEGRVGSVVVTVNHDEVGIFSKRGLQQACRLYILHALVGSRDAIGVGERNMEKEENRFVGVGSVELSQFVGHPLHRAQRVGVVPCVLEEIESAVEHHKVETLNLVMIGPQQLQLAQRTVVGLLIVGVVGC